MPMSPEDCRCDGSGIYTVSIPVADAVVPIERQCPVHGQAHTPVRQLAFDTSTKRIGEVVQEPTQRGYFQQYSLRPVGGGLEWEARPRHVQLLNDDIPMES